MKNPGGFYADDFDEACAWLTERGFQNARGENTSVDARTDRSAMMVSPSGFAFDLCSTSRTAINGLLLISYVG